MDPNKDRRVIKGLRQGARKKKQMPISASTGRCILGQPTHTMARGLTFSFHHARARARRGNTVPSVWLPTSNHRLRAADRNREGVVFRIHSLLVDTSHRFGTHALGHGRGHVAQAARFLSLHLPQAGRLLSQRRPLARASSVLAVFRVTCR